MVAHFFVAIALVLTGGAIRTDAVVTTSEEIDLD